MKVDDFDATTEGGERVRVLVTQERIESRTRGGIVYTWGPVTGMALEDGTPVIMMVNTGLETADGRKLTQVE